jgi:hypothetical protein
LSSRPVPLWESGNHHFANGEPKVRIHLPPAASLDRRCRPAPLPPLPEQARNAGKCSPSPTYPQAPQPTKDLILMK